MKKVKYSVIQDKWEDGLPTYYILKMIYFFGIHFYSQLIGQNGKDISFQDLESAEDYLKLITNKNN